jgi:hypothetical protein
MLICWRLTVVSLTLAACSFVPVDNAADVAVYSRGNRGEFGGTSIYIPDEPSEACAHPLHRRHKL